jgi:hypothetical protein
MSFIVYLFEGQIQVFQKSAYSYLNTSALYNFYFGTRATSGVPADGGNACCTAPSHSRCRSPCKGQSYEPMQAATRSKHEPVRKSTEADDGNFEH